MAQDVFISRGTISASKPDAGGANIRSVPVFGIVKDNVDPNRTGALRVYISDFSGPDPENSANWIKVNYLSTFFGRVTPSAGDTTLGSYTQNSSSYGEWHAPPDIGTTVICIFVNGDMNYGFYIGAVPEPQSLQMVPAIGAVETVVPNPEEAKQYGGATVLPVTNMNSKNRAKAYDNSFIETPKPVHSYSAAVMAQQGVIRDSIRGPITSSAQREPTSRVGWGVSTPGRPIYEGGYDDKTVLDNLDPSKAQNLRVVARRGGHSIVMDDGDIAGNDDLIRIRTALGHQITMSDNGQTLMILHSNGQSYIELGKEGTVDVYSTNSVNVRTQGDLNLHADNNVNIHAKKDMNFHAENFKFTAEKDLQQKVGKNYKISTGGTHTTKVSGAMAFQSSGEASFASSGTTYINGSKINLNTGKASTKPEEVESITIINHTDTVFDSSKGFISAPGKLKSITSRTPAHCPWIDAGKGVDVSVDLTGGSSSTNSPMSSVTRTSSLSPVRAVSVATAVSAPVTNQISNSFDSATTGAILGAVAQNAAVGPYREAQQRGAAIVNDANESVVAAGNFAQTPEKLEQAGVTKPGSSRLINGLTRTGVEVASLLPDTLFSGKFGAEKLSSYTVNTQAQAEAQITNLQQSQTQLINSGVITGNEISTQIAGVVLATTKVGIEQTTDAIRTINSGTSGNLVNEETLKQISSGTQAASMAQTELGTASGTIDAIKSLNPGADISELGPEKAATNTISENISNMIPGQPQDLQVLNSRDQNKTNAAAGENQSLTTNLENISIVRKPLISDPGILASGINSLPGAAAAVSLISSISGIKLPGTEKITSNMEKVDSLKKVATIGLSVAAISSLAGGLAALTGKGKNKTKTPKVATDTVERAAIDNSVVSLLNDPKIPPPDYSGSRAPRVVQSSSANNEMRDIQRDMKKNEDRRKEISRIVQEDQVNKSLTPGQRVRLHQELANLRSEYNTLIDRDKQLRNRSTT